MAITTIRLLTRPSVGEHAPYIPYRSSPLGHHARRPPQGHLPGNHRLGRYCKLLTADNQKTADSPSSSRGVLPHSSELKLLANGAEPRTNRPTEQGNNHAGKKCVCCSFVHTRHWLFGMAGRFALPKSERKHWNEGVPIHILPDRRFWPSGPQETNVLLLHSANGLTICGDQRYRKPCQHLNTMWAVQKEERRRGALNQSRARSSRKWNCDVKPRTLIDCPAAGYCSEDEVGGI
jgi:hypothetical protein